MGVISVMSAAFGGAVSAEIIGTGADRTIKHEVVVEAPIADVWHAWTTVDGLTKFFAPGAKVELREGGPFEIYFMPDAPEGQRGADGCRVIAFKPMESLSFTWNAPPSIPNLRSAGKQTNVTLNFQEIEPGKVHVSLTQPVPETGEDWDKYAAYFEKAWPAVLKNLQSNIGKIKAPRG